MLLLPLQKLELYSVSNTLEALHFWGLELKDFEFFKELPVLRKLDMGIHMQDVRFPACSLDCLEEVRLTKVSPLTVGEVLTACPNLRKLELYDIPKGIIDLHLPKTLVSLALFGTQARIAGIDRLELPEVELSNAELHGDSFHFRNSNSGDMPTRIS
jgi:hypothetical protein